MIKKKSIKQTAKALGISTQIVRRILITNNIFISERSKDIHRLLLSGYTIDQIAEAIGVRRKAVTQHLPYTKGSYVIGQKTENALRIRASRDRKIEREKNKME